MNLIRKQIISVIFKNSFSDCICLPYTYMSIKYVYVTMAPKHKPTTQKIQNINHPTQSNPYSQHAPNSASYHALRYLVVVYICLCTKSIWEITNVLGKIKICICAVAIQIVFNSIYCQVADRICRILHICTVKWNFVRKASWNSYTLVHLWTRSLSVQCFLHSVRFRRTVTYLIDEPCTSIHFVCIIRWFCC